MIDKLRDHVQRICAASSLLDGNDFDAASANRRARVWADLMQRQDLSVSFLSFRQHDEVVYNVLAGPWWQPGALWLSAHHDHCGGLGAADNATAMAVLVEVARAIPQHLQGHMVFASFGCEENSMAGAKHFVAHHPTTAKQIGAMINLECLGVRGWETVIVTRRWRTVRSDPRLVKTLRQANPDYRPRVCPAHYSSDHIQFQRTGVPVGELMGMPPGQTNNPVHTKDDVPANVDFSELQTIVQTLLNFLWTWK